MERGLGFELYQSPARVLRVTNHNELVTSCHAEIAHEAPHGPRHQHQKTAPDVKCFLNVDKSDKSGQYQHPTESFLGLIIQLGNDVGNARLH